MVVFWNQNIGFESSFLWLLMMDVKQPQLQWDRQNTEM